MDLSLIIATYNIEDYIGCCLESCINQIDFEGNYEIIVVNDGSTDDSIKIVEGYQKKHSHIKILNKENGGLSSARNAGLEIAIGEYIWFIDGDDKISEYSLSTIVKAIKMSKKQAYLINYCELYNNGICSVPQIQLKGIEDLNPYKHIQERGELLPMMAWLTIYSREFLNYYGLRFTEGIIHEDLDFSVRANSKAKEMGIIHNPLYYYRISRPGSIMNQSKKKSIMSLKSYIKIEEIWSSFFSKNKDLQRLKHITIPIISEYILYNNEFPNLERNKKRRTLYYISNIFRGNYKKKIRLGLFILTSRKTFTKIFPGFN